MYQKEKRAIYVCICESGIIFTFCEFEHMASNDLYFFFCSTQLFISSALCGCPVFDLCSLLINMDSHFYE